MNNLQATVELVKMMRQHPDLKDRAESVIAYIAELTALAVMATDNLTVAARKLSDDPVITNNAMVLRNKLDALYDDGRGEGED